MKKYLPIRIHHIYFGYGWWWGKKFYFFSRRNGLEMMVMAKECCDAIYAKSGKLIGHGAILSWDETRQRKSELKLIKK